MDLDVVVPALAEVTETAPGLTEAELVAVEEALGRQLPLDLRALYAAALPVGPRFPDWRGDPGGEAVRGRAWVEGALTGDLVDGWWSPVLGPRPDDVGEQLEVVVARLAAEPPLVRVRGHRFATVTGGPVLSVYSARDSVRYGDDLPGWLARELGLPVAAQVDRPAPLPFWDALLELGSTEPE
ncbi:MAG: hypothetical protein JWN17_2285 [Frankiales bacterium]|nr:hypothetical protein [Frankiales bacterium]